MDGGAMSGGEHAFIFGICLIFGIVGGFIVTLLMGRAQFLPEQKPVGPAVSPRAIFFFLWLLIIWAGLGLSLPFWLDYFSQIQRAGGGLPRLRTIGIVTAFPLALLVMIGIGYRRGYLQWILDLKWPDRENR
jgi:hypothetical protein